MGGKGSGRKARKIELTRQNVRHLLERALGTLHAALMNDDTSAAVNVLRLLGGDELTKGGAAGRVFVFSDSHGEALGKLVNEALPALRRGDIDALSAALGEAKKLLDEVPDPALGILPLEEG